MLLLAEAAGRDSGRVKPQLRVWGPLTVQAEGAEQENVFRAIPRRCALFVQNFC